MARRIESLLDSRSTESRTTSPCAAGVQYTAPRYSVPTSLP